MTRVMTHNSDSFQSLDIVDVYESRLAAVVTQDPVGVHLMIHRQDVTFGEAELPRGHGDVMAEGFHWAPVWKMHIIDGLVQGVSNFFPGDPNVSIKSTRDPKQKQMLPNSKGSERVSL